MPKERSRSSVKAANNINKYIMKLEIISSEIHLMWMSWAKKIIQEEKNISKERIERWEKECFLPYKELSEEMKELDRKFARKIITIINEQN